MVRNPFKRKKKEEKTVEQKLEKTEMTNLEKIVGTDKELYIALQHTMFLDPRKVKVTLEEAARKAADFEKKSDTKKASIWYHVAGALALWKGDASKVEQYFSQCHKLTPEMDYEPITKIPEKAVAKAQEYYKTFLG